MNWMSVSPCSAHRMMPDSDDNDLLEEDAPENSEDFINCFEQLHELLEEAEDNETKDSSESSGEFVPLKDTLQGNRRNAKKKEAEPLANRNQSILL